MTDTSGKWRDLGPRLASGAAMVFVGLGGIWFGGDVFHVLVAAVCGAMVWELARILAPEKRALAWQLGIVSAVAVLLASYLPDVYALPLIAAAVLVGLGQISRYMMLYSLFGLVVLAAGWNLIHVRDDLGFGWLMWLVVVVVATDVAGYFAGRTIGGPKFWPAVSPKKTWSGTIAGWLAAAVVGVIFAWGSGIVGLIVLCSVILSFASQMGDIAESAMKRHMGIKDSSALIPGHGGVLDRFDGMLGAAIAFIVLEQVFGLPWVAA